jgi:hypothetical protein
VSSNLKEERESMSKEIEEKNEKNREKRNTTGRLRLSDVPNSNRNRMTSREILVFLMSLYFRCSLSNFAPFRTESRLLLRIRRKYSEVMERTARATNKPTTGSSIFLFPLQNLCENTKNENAPFLSVNKGELQDGHDKVWVLVLLVLMLLFSILFTGEKKKEEEK